MKKKPKPSENTAEKVETKYLNVKLTKPDVIDVINMLNSSTVQVAEAEKAVSLRNKFVMALKNG